MQLRMKMLLLGAQPGCNKLCKAGDRVCTRCRVPPFLLALCSPQRGGGGSYWPELMCSKLLSSELPGMVRKQQEQGSSLISCQGTCVHLMC